MKESIQLRIPTPCGEDWEHMQPIEQGRHCQHCCKTVVDFTAMSDTEIIRYITQGPSNICGRLMPDQLGRKLAPAPVQRNGWSGWRWVIASVLMVAKGSDNNRVVKPPVEMREDTGRKDVRAEALAGKIGYSAPVVMGDTEIREERRSAEMGIVGRVPPIAKDSARMGTPAVESVDSVLVPMDTMPVMAPAGIQPPAQRELEGFTGGISVGQDVKKTPVDTVIDILKQAAADTLTALNILPKNELTVYPNPVARGGVLQLAGQMKPGKYQLSLLNIGGMLVQQRLLEVAVKGQVDQWELPVGLAAGIYFLRVVKEGGADICVREVMVR